MKLFKNGVIHTGVQEIPIKGDILVEAGKIIEIGNVSQNINMEVIDLQGKLVYPGFVDAHCHIGLWESAIGFEGSDGN